MNISLFMLAAGMLLSFFLGRLSTWGSRNPDMMADIVAFHEKFGLTYSGPPRVLPTELANFRINFMQEELNEYVDAEAELGAFVNDAGILDVGRDQHIDYLLEQELDALVDLGYVQLGTAYLQFGPKVFYEAWRRVHAKNMQKIRKLKTAEDDGHKDSGRAAQYDVVKPNGWTPPSHTDLIQQRHNKLWPLAADTIEDF